MRTGRIEEDCPGDGEPLALAAGEGHASLANPRVVAAGQTLDEVMKLGDLGRPDDAFHVHVVEAVGYVVLYAGGEDEGVLHDYSDVPPE